MERRRFLGMAMAGSAMAIFTPRVHAAPPVRGMVAGGGGGDLPQRRRIRVAFLLGENANVIDTAGPWEVFQDTMLRNHHHPFRLYTVAPTREIVTMTGGLKVQPHYSVTDAPQPQVIVVPAQRTHQASLDWLAKASAGTDVTMSVCTGAFQLARAGLLGGLAATTHHQFWDAFAEEFPDIELRRGLRFVDSGRIATAGGLTSGIDMALHVVRRYFGAAVAEATERYMEHDSDAWRTG